jgi:RND superfamily putative drug exporter
LVIAIWVVLTVVGALGARHVGDVFRGDITKTPGSESEAVEHYIHEHFDRQYPFPFLFTLTSERLTVDDPAYQQAIDRLITTLSQHPKVGGVLSYRDDATFVSADRHHSFLLTGLKVADFREATELVRPLSALAHKVPLPPDLKLALTGNPPITVDMESASSQDGARTEARVIPLVVIVMVLLFGALVAAIVPVIVGLIACTLSFGLLYVLGQFVELNVFAQNFVTMMGLGVGIDYSLFIVSRFREEMAAGYNKAEAAIRATDLVGRSIAYSGAAVCIGLLAMLIPKLPLTESLSIGGILAVLMTVLLALTLLPALLACLGDRINSPRAFNRFLLSLSRSKEFWQGWSNRVMRRPLTYLLLSLVMLLGLSALTLQLQTWNSNILLMPDKLESRRGFEVLTKTAGGRQISPVGVVVGTRHGEPVYQPETLAQIHQFSKDLQRAVPLSRVISIVDLNPEMTLDDYQGMMTSMVAMRAFNPQAQHPLISRDDARTLFWLLPPPESTEQADRDLVRDLRQFRDRFVAAHPDLDITMGGGPAQKVDFLHAVHKGMPTVVLATVVTTLLVMMLSFRSLLLPIKSVIANLLSVTASLGILVAVFQFGWGSSLLGIATPPGALLHFTPLALFCVIFGLSMDYEIFLMSRIKEEYDRTGDAEGSVTTGLQQTGGIITSAALIMIIVFVGFAFSETIIVKEMGLGLSVAIALDITIIRLLLVPSFMALAGKAAWWFPKGLNRLLPDLDLRH